MASNHKFMEYFYRIFLPNISQNVSFKKNIKSGQHSTLAPKEVD